MDIKQTWFSILSITLSLSGIANAADDPGKEDSTSFRLSETESKQVMCSLYNGYSNGVSEDSVLAYVCLGKTDISQLSPTDMKVLKTDVLKLSRTINESAGGHVI